MSVISKPELLSPAGSLEKLKFAVKYGADAVYFGGKEFSLRAGADNLTIEEINEGTEFAHSHGVKTYAALNIFANNEDIDSLKSYVNDLVTAQVDGIIVSDMGIFMIAKKYFPQVPIFVSVQANVINYAAANYWAELGAKRVTLARELRLDEIKKIADSVDIETEIFIHGAVCISYSGRCLLSKYMENRDANKGNCAHCCRWKYYLTEEKRPKEHYPVYEDERGTYIFSSKDLCLLNVLPEIISSGVSSLKIEGRMKSLHYVSVATKVYREAIDSYVKDPSSYQLDGVWMQELQKISHRQYTEGFIHDEEEKECLPNYIRDSDFVGVVKGASLKDKLVFIDVKNRIYNGEELEVIKPSGKSSRIILKDMRRIGDNEILKAAHANYSIYIVSEPLPEYSILRRLVRQEC